MVTTEVPACAAQNGLQFRAKPPIFDVQLLLKLLFVPGLTRHL